MREIDLIVLHCTACPKGRDSTVHDIRAEHRARGWDDIGYHYLIRLDGTLELGRPVSTPGAHAYGFNQKSIGVAYVGGEFEDTRTPQQRKTMELVVAMLRSIWPEASIRGHRELPNVAKLCPNFDVRQWLTDLNIDPK